MHFIRIKCTQSHLVLSSVSFSQKEAMKYLKNNKLINAIIESIFWPSFILYFFLKLTSHFLHYVNLNIWRLKFSNVNSLTAFARRLPFEEIGGNELRVMWAIHENRRPPPIAGCPPVLEELMTLAWQKEADLRYFLKFIF